MSDTEKIDIWSSWHVIQGDLLSTIETRNSNGALLNLTTDNPPTVILKQSEDNGVTCQLHLDTSKLNGYYLQGVAVTSEARNVEVYYDNGEYIGTAGRSILKNTEDDEHCLLCCCTFELDHDIIITKLLLKLLSLRGKDQITIHKISLQLMENYGRGEEQEAMNTPWYNPSSLINDLPPIVQSLVNGLDHGNSSLDEMNKIIMMLRDARIAKEEIERKNAKEEIERKNAKEEKERKETEKEIENEKEESEAPLVTDIPNNDPLTALEMKLKQFVTNQLALLEQKLETKLNNLVRRLDNLESVNNK